MHLLNKATYRLMSFIILYLSFFSSAATAANLEIINGNLFDSRTGLTWQRLDAVIVTQLPLDPQLNGARVATFNELNNLIPLNFGVPSTVSVNSDIYKALTFFYASRTDYCNTCLSYGTEPTGEGFAGWAQGTGDGVDYETSIYTFNPVPRPLGGIVNSVQYTGVSTIGSYSANWCSSCRGPLFTVLNVPEPSTFALLPLGLILVFLKSRKITKV
jgi:PEP-CTERM motif